MFLMLILQNIQDSDRFYLQNTEVNMKLKIIINLLLASLMWVTSSARAADEVTDETSKPALNDSKCVSSLNALKWYRDSSERNAIYREVFFLAENVIKQQVSSEGLKPKQWGVVLDIDETALDNSWWFYQQDVNNVPITKTDFATKIESIATPGVKQFVQDIHAMGGYVNFVTNRPIMMQKITEENLIKEGIYYDQILLDGSNSQTVSYGKSPRFLAVENGTSPSILPPQKIIAWFGDNIQDFPQLKQDQMFKQNPNGDAYKQFGVTYFALPNPMYGSWKNNSFN